MHMCVRVQKSPTLKKTHIGLGKQKTKMCLEFSF